MRPANRFGFAFALVMLAFFAVTAIYFSDDLTDTVRGIPMWLVVSLGLGVNLWLAAHAWRKPRGTP